MRPELLDSCLAGDAFPRAEKQQGEQGLDTSASQVAMLDTGVPTVDLQVSKEADVERLALLVLPLRGNLGGLKLSDGCQPDMLLLFNEKVLELGMYVYALRMRGKMIVNMRELDVWDAAL